MPLLVKVGRDAAQQRVHAVGMRRGTGLSGGAADSLRLHDAERVFEGVRPDHLSDVLSRLDLR